MHNYKMHLVNDRIKLASNMTNAGLREPIRILPGENRKAFWVIFFLFKLFPAFLLCQHINDVIALGSGEERSKCLDGCPEKKLPLMSKYNIDNSFN